MQKNRLNRAVIFAGGKSSRMGRDKALLPFGEYSSLAEYQYQRLSKIFEEVYISSKDNKFDFDVNIIEDNDKESSPLVALISIFENLEVDEVFILSVDAPFVSKEIIEQLYKNISENADVMVAKSPNGIEPLCGIYRASILPYAKKAFSLNNHRLSSLLQSLNCEYLMVESREAFLNLNRPFDYEKALEKLI